MSLAGSPPVKDGEGQGERLLLTSGDGTLVVKKIASEEVADMHHILSEYHQVRHEPPLPSLIRPSLRSPLYVRVLLILFLHN